MSKFTCKDCHCQFEIDAEDLLKYAQLTKTVSSDYAQDDGGWMCESCAD